MSIVIIGDLRLAFGEARDQGNRPTCLAFAASDSHAAVQKISDYFSVEYAFFNAVRRRIPFDANCGVTLRSMIDSIGDDGQPFEVAWSYLSAVPDPISLWTPPQHLGKIFKHDFKEVAANFAQATTSIQNGIPVILGFRTSEQFHNPPDTNVIEDLQSDADVGVHAVVAVGAGELGGERLVLVRNSWGCDWGTDGHVWLTEKYLSPRLIAMALCGAGVN